MSEHSHDSEMMEEDDATTMKVQNFENLFNKTAEMWKAAIESAKNEAMQKYELEEDQASSIVKPLIEISEMLVEDLRKTVLAENAQIPSEEETRILRFLRSGNKTDVDEVARLMEAGSRVLTLEENFGKSMEKYIEDSVQEHHMFILQSDTKMENLKKKLEGKEGEIKVLKMGKGEIRARKQSPIPSLQLTNFGKSKVVKEEKDMKGTGDVEPGQKQRQEKKENGESGVSKVLPKARSENESEKNSQERVQRWIEKQEHHENDKKPKKEKKDEEKKSKISGRSEMSNETKLERMRGSRKSGSSNESMKEELMNMARFMKVSSMPDPEVYFGKPQEKLEDFLALFELKYKQNMDSSAEMVAVLKAKFLKGEAKKLFESIDIEESMTWREIAEKFKKVMNASRTSQKGRAVERWQDLRIRQDQSLQNFLIFVDSLAKEAFNSSKEEVDMIKTAKLLQAAKRNPTLAGLLAVKKNDAKDGQQYEKLKAAALQFEYDLERNKYKSEYANKEKRNSRPSSENGNAGRYVETRKCFICGKEGHIAARCRDKNGNQTEIKMVNGKNMIEKAEIMRQKLDILIDSGADICVISTRTFNNLKRRSGNWEKYIMKRKYPRNFEIYDCNRRPMRVIEMVDIKVKIRNKSSIVKLHVVQNNQETLILGVDKFDDFGIYVGWRDDEEKENADISSRSGKYERESARGAAQKYWVENEGKGGISSKPPYFSRNWYDEKKKWKNEDMKGQMDERRSRRYFEQEDEDQERSIKSVELKNEDIERKVDNGYSRWKCEEKKIEDDHIADQSEAAENEEAEEQLDDIGRRWIVEKEVEDAKTQKIARKNVTNPKVDTVVRQVKKVSAEEEESERRFQERFSRWKEEQNTFVHWTTQKYEDQMEQFLRNRWKC